MADQARTIRLPAHIAEAISKLARGQRQMLQDLGREPTPNESAAELDMTAEKVIEVQKYGREPISLHTLLGEDGDRKFGDLIKDSEAIQPGEALSFTLLQEQLHWVLGTPSEREAGVVSLGFGLLQLPLPTGERDQVPRQRPRRRRHPARHRAQRRELRLQPRHPQLEDPHRTLQILQPVHPQIPQRRPQRQDLTHQRGRRLRHQHLAPHSRPPPPAPRDAHPGPPGP